MKPSEAVRNSLGAEVVSILAFKSILSYNGEERWIMSDTRTDIITNDVFISWTGKDDVKAYLQDCDNYR